MASFGDSYIYSVDTQFDGSGVKAGAQAVKAFAVATNDASVAAKEASRVAREAAAAKKAEERAARSAALAAREEARAKADAAKLAQANARVAKEEARAKAEVARAAIAEARALKEAERAALAAAKANQVGASASKAAATATTQHVVAAEKFRASSAGVQGGTRNMAQGMTQLTYVIDDMQYGMRGLMNQIPMITTALFGFGPAAAAAGLAFTALAGYFRDDIDQMLAWAGVLDENVVKGMEKGGEKANEFRKQIESLNETFANAPSPTKEMASNVSKIFDDAGQAATEGIVEMFDAVNNPGATASYERAKALIKKKMDEVAASAQVDTSGAGKIGRFVQLRQLRKDLEDLEKSRASILAHSTKRLEDLKEAAAGGDDSALQRLSDIAFDQFAKSGDQAFADLGQSLFELTEDFKKASDAAEVGAFKLEQMAKAAEENGKAAKEVGKAWLEDAVAGVSAYINKIGEVNRAEAEWEEQRRQRRAEQNRANLDANTRRVVEAAGADPRVAATIGNTLRGGVAMGMSPDQAGQQAMLQVVNILRAAGVGNDESVGAAQQLVGEQQGQVQAFVDANNMRAQFDRQMLGNFDVMIQLHDRNRMMAIQGLQRAEQQGRQMMRFNNRFAPMRMMQGNNLRGGW